MDEWEYGFGPNRFGSTFSNAATPAQTETHAIPMASPDSHGGDLLHPSNPMLAFGVILAVAGGLAAFSTSIRVGKTKAGIKIGDTK